MAKTDVHAPDATGADPRSPEDPLPITWTIADAVPAEADGASSRLPAYGPVSGGRLTSFDSCRQPGGTREPNLIVVCARDSAVPYHRLDSAVGAAATIVPESDRAALTRGDYDGKGNCGVVGLTECALGFIPMLAIAAKAVQVTMLAVKGEDLRTAFKSGQTEYERYLAAQPKR
jgi:hypothetical protein